MRIFKCCFGCEERCENCHSACQAYRKELLINKTIKEVRAQKEKGDKEYRNYENSKAKKIEGAARRKHR